MTRMPGSAETDSRQASATAALARFERFLGERALRLTQPRIAIVEALLERKGHFRIEELVEDLERRGISGSKATVYRTLPLLLEAGLIQAASLEGDHRTYETSLGQEHHDHLVCRSCGKVVEFEFEAFEILQREVAARYGFVLERHYHQLVGRCEACRAKSAEVSPSGGHAAHPPPRSDSDT